MSKSTFELAPRGSFSWSAAFSVLTRFSPLGHVWAGTEREVRLSLLSDGDLAPVTVTLEWDGALRGRVSDPSRVETVARQVARIFSLDHDGAGWHAMLERAPRLREVAGLLPGLRPVCFSSPYEAACWAIVSQRISKTQAARVVAGLVAEHGSFPTPEKLLRLEQVRGLAPVKVDRLHAVAAAARGGVLDAERLRALGDDEGPASLRAIPGIGPFWSSGIYLRACGIRDVFPDEPLSVAALARVHGLGPSPSAEEIRRVTDTFRPFRMWACFLLRVADGRGLLGPPGTRILDTCRPALSLRKYGVRAPPCGPAANHDLARRREFEYEARRHECPPRVRPPRP